MTVTGCVAAGADSSNYMLTNGMVQGDTAGKLYTLMGNDLQPHVGHEVDITGVVSDSKLGKRTMKTKDRMSEENMGSNDKVQSAILQIKSVKMIGPTCS